MKGLDVRWQQRLQNYQRAMAHLTAAVELRRQRDLSLLEQQGLVQAFEFTHELAWHTLKDFLESRGAARMYGSRDATREGFAHELIEDGELWMEMIRDRNRSTRVYDDGTVDTIAQAIAERYFPAFQQLAERMTRLAKEEAA